MDVDPVVARVDPLDQGSQNRPLAFYRQLQAAESDPVVLADAGFVLGRIGQDIDAALALVSRALELNPSYARGWHWAGWLFACNEAF